jgi:Photosynthesis affected mutant 68
MPSKSSRDRLAFEPNQKKKKTPKQPPIQPQKESTKTKNAARKKATERSIPEVVSKRMIRRMAFFSGIPTGLAMSSFFVFYWIISHEWLEIPTSAVGAVTLGLFGLGVLGLSYGIFSTSWDEDRIGGLIGAQEFKTNFGRMTAAWREAKEAEKQAKKS